MTMENNRQEAVIRLLSNGGKYSVIAIANALRIGDPRSVIRDIRKRGIVILDEWKTTQNGKGRYKLYFINSNNA